MPSEPTNESATEAAPAATEQPENVFTIKPNTVPGCKYCELYGGGMMPPHFASPNCQSGGHNHCTCGTCF